MGARGPRSSAAIALIAPPTAVKRPDPPATLSKAAAAEWQRIVGSMPADWFRPETLPLLEALCCAIVETKRLCDLTASFETSWMADPEGLARYEKLVALGVKQASLVVLLSTKLRLTHQSRYTPTKAATTVRSHPLLSGGAPWQAID
jgi:hypothetical protein